MSDGWGLEDEARRLVRRFSRRTRDKFVMVDFTINTSWDGGEEIVARFVRKSDQEARNRVTP